MVVFTVGREPLRNGFQVQTHQTFKTSKPMTRATCDLVFVHDLESLCAPK